MTSPALSTLAPSPAEPLRHQVLAGLAQHRIATTSQLRRMLRPDGTRQLLSMRFLEFCRYLRSLYPPKIRIAIVLGNFSPHLTTKKDTRVGDWAAVNHVELAYTPTNSSWLDRIEARFTALRYFTLDRTDHASHKEQGSMIRRYIIWRNKHTADIHLRTLVARVNVA